MRKKVTVREERCLQEIMRGVSQIKAYRIAYPRAERWTDNAVAVQVSRMLAKPKICLRLQEMRDDRAAANAITVDRVLKEQAKLAFTDLPGIVKFDGVKMSVADFDTLTSEQRACIQSFKVKTEREMEYDENGKPTATPVQYVEVKLYSKQDALDKLGEFLGIGKEKKKEEEPEGPLKIGFTQVNIYNDNRKEEK